MNRKRQVIRQKTLEEKSLEQIKLESKKIQRKLIITAASIAACLAIGYPAINYYSSRNQEKNSAQYAEQKTDMRLEQARKNPESRQKYLESLVSSNDIPFSSGVVYDADGKMMLEYCRNMISNIETNPVEVETALKKVRESLLDSNTSVKTPEILDLNGQGIKPPIYVNRLFFEATNSLCATSEDIIHVLKYHEGRHAEQVSRGLSALGYLDKETIIRGIKNGKLAYEFVYGLGEIDALNSELSAIESGKSKVSRKLYEKTLREYQQGRTLFEKAMLINSPVQREFIKKVLQQNPRR